MVGSGILGFKWWLLLPIFILLLKNVKNLSFSNVFFITRKEYTAKERKKILLDILEYIDIVSTGKHQVVQALKNDDIFLQMNL